ncbi:MAG: hypothetical protein C0403_17325 [Desulfobacterium sp.]|nr:hypothetical protein [Desulfobacterium sp.]
MVDMSVNFGGLRLKNPLIAAAGPITTNMDNVKRLVDAGIGAIVTKTGFTKNEYERWVGRKNIFPYKPVFKYQSLQNGRLLSLPTLSDIPVSDMAKRLEEIKKLNVPVIGSIMGLSPKGYAESAKMLCEAGADAIEIDLCCTIPEFTTTYRWAGQNVNFYPKKYAHLVDVVKDITSIPVGVKSTVSLYLYGKIIEALIRSKLKNSLPDFITLVGQLDQNPGVDLNTLQPIIPHIPTFGWQGTLSGLTYSALATFTSTLGTSRPFFSASGGIDNHEGVINAMALGATTVQLMTVILNKGPEIITKILGSLHYYLASKKITHIETLVGCACRDYIPSMALGKFMLERDTLYGKMFAEVLNDSCIGCGICESVCTEGAVKLDNGKAMINQSLCRACNLCVLKCPEKAIRLLNIELLDKLIDKYKDAPGIRSFREFFSKQKITWRDKLLLARNLRQWGLT